MMTKSETDVRSSIDSTYRYEIPGRREGKGTYPTYHVADAYLAATASMLLIAVCLVAAMAFLASTNRSNEQRCSLSGYRRVSAFCGEMFRVATSEDYGCQQRIAKYE